LESARQGIVLLKNDGQRLPLTLSANLTLAVVGPHATSTVDLLGNYHGTLFFGDSAIILESCGEIFLAQVRTKFIKLKFFFTDYFM